MHAPDIGRQPFERIRRPRTGTAYRAGLSLGAQLLLVALLGAIAFAMGALLFRLGPHSSDFALYYRDARIGWNYGWSHMYDSSHFTATTQQLGIHNNDPVVPSLSVPLLTWIVAPYALLPFSVAYVAWLATLLAGLWLAWRLLAPPTPLPKHLHVLVAALFLPLIFGFTLGSALVILLGAIAVAWWLLDRGHPIAAGFVLCLCLVRPQVCLLIPICLLAAGRRRLFAAFLGGTAIVILLVLAVVPLPAIEAYVLRIGSAAQNPVAWSVASELSFASLRPPAVAIGLMALVSVAAIIVSFQARNEKGADAIALSAGIVGSLLLAPYIHIQDLALLLLVVWLFLRSFSFRFWPVVVCALVFAANLEIARTTVVPAGIETLFLLLLLTLPFWKARWVSNEAVAVP